MLRQPVSVLMLVAVTVTAFALPPTSPAGRRTSLAEPFLALRHRGLLVVAVTAVLIGCVVVAGAVLGVNNTLITESVMRAAPVERGVASAAYSFLRFGGGAIAPWPAGKLGESIGLGAPYWFAACAVALGVLVITVWRRRLAVIEAGPGHGAPAAHSRDEAEAEAVAVGDA